MRTFASHVLVVEHPYLLRILLNVNRDRHLLLLYMLGRGRRLSRGLSPIR